MRVGGGFESVYGVHEFKPKKFKLPKREIPPPPDRDVGMLTGNYGMPVNARGYSVMPDVGKRPMYGVKKQQHATFPELRIDDMTTAHAKHYSQAKQVEEESSNTRSGLPALGLRWEHIGPESPEIGTELFNDELARQLASGKLVFTKKEFEDLGAGVMQADHYIKANQAGYFRPSGLRHSVLHDKGKLDAEAEESIANQLNRLLAVSSGKLLDLFREWDLDSDGSVDMHELYHALRALGYDAPSEDFRKLFKALGGDDNGRLEYDKLKRSLTEAGVSIGVSWHAGWCRSTRNVVDVGAAPSGGKGSKSLGKCHYVDGQHPLMAMEGSDLPPTIKMPPRAGRLPPRAANINQGASSSSENGVPPPKSAFGRSESTYR